MTSRFTAPETRQLTTFLLELHGRSHDLGYRGMQRFAFERLRQLLPFEGALCGVGTVHGSDLQGHDIFLLDQPPELMTSWEMVKTEDRLAYAAISAPGTTVTTSVDGPLYDGCDRIREHCRRFGLEHLQCTAHIYPEAGLYWVMSIYRSVALPAFTEDERLTNELVSPHLFAAMRNARIGELRTIARLGGGHGQVAAIASATGLVLEAEPGLAELFQLEWPNWKGPFLPERLAEALADGHGRIEGRRLVVKVASAHGDRLVHARRRVAADDLTERERQIAEAFALGDSHRDIGERLDIAPATVRRHLANAYEKLGVSSKAELDRMLRASE